MRGGGMSIKITKDDFFVDEDTIDFGNKRYKVVKISFDNVPLIVIKASKGYVATTHLDKKKIESLGEIACFISPVLSLNSLRRAKIKDLTSWAEELGIKQGMTLKRALEILDGEK